MRVWTLYWAPEGRPIALVTAKSASAAVRQARGGYKRYLGELYAVEGEVSTNQTLEDWRQ